MEDTHRQVPLCIAELDERENRAVLDVLNSGWLAPGEYNKEFERKFAEYVGVKHAIALNSCTSALHLAIQASGITGEIIVPSFTFVASANAIITAGAKPVFADIQEDTRALDPEKIRKKITDKTQAIMVVHYGGQAADLEEILSLCERYNLLLIEDSAETLGGTYDGRMTGSYGIGCFSFFPTKNITTAEGGMLTTNDDNLAATVRALSGHGILNTTYEREKKEKPWLRAATFPGYNFRMSNIQAAIGSIQMDKLPEMNQKRETAAQYLTEQLKELPGIQPPTVKERRNHVYQTYSVILDESINRTALIKYLRNHGIQASVHFDPPVHLQPAYNNGTYDTTDLQVTERVAARIISLPMYPSIQREDLDYVVHTLKEGLACQ